MFGTYPTTTTGLETTFPQLTLGATKRSTNPKVIAEIIMYSGEFCVYDLCEIDVTHVEAIQMLADRYGAIFWTAGGNIPAAIDATETETKLKFLILIHIRKEELIGNLGIQLARCENIARWVIELPCAMVAADSSWPSALKEALRQITEWFLLTRPRRRRGLTDPDCLIQGGGGEQREMNDASIDKYGVIRKKIGQSH